MNLELMAMRWLWLDKTCHYVIQERTPRYGIGQPDVLGVMRNRHLIEIEIKRSGSDFIADFKKPHRRNRGILDSTFPRQFYYLMPRELAEKYKEKIPAWAGLMQNSLNNFTCEVVKVAPVNENAQRLSIKECVKMARAMVAHMMSEKYRLESNKNRFVENDETTFVEWVPARVGTYEI
jgi:hypothetical protein